jgi:predicted nicotinamide N-methyase
VTDLPPQTLAHIAAHFPLTPVPAIPEIVLHKAAPSSGIWRLAEAEGADFLAPYWSSWWGGGVALARWVLDHPAPVAGKSVLDVGAGSGLVGIAAAKAGAARVLAVDVDRYAVAATRLNAAANGVEIEARCGDGLEGAAPDVDVVLVGDLFYEPALAARTSAFLERCIARGIAAYVGDPGRASLPRARLRLIAEYESADYADSENARGWGGVFESRWR